VEPLKNPIELIEERQDYLDFGFTNIDILLAKTEPWRIHKGVQSEDEKDIG
jgi:hypothetical protein